MTLAMSVVLLMAILSTQMVTLIVLFVIPTSEVMGLPPITIVTYE